MKKLALLLCAILVMGVVGTGALAKKGGSGRTKDNGYGKGGRFVGPPEWAESHHDDSDDSDDTEQMEAQDSDQDQDDQQTVETEETGEGDDDGNAPWKALGKNRETPRSPADYIGLNKPGGTRHLYLYEKNPTDWSIVEDGAWGKMTFRLVGKTLRFTFTGHGLEPGWDYSLIYYPEPWPGEGLVCLGSATANKGGQVHISDRVDAEDIPMEGPDTVKIWLVLSEDVDCVDGEEGTQMIGWNPTEYLFEYNAITFEDTDDNGDGTQDTESTEEPEGE